jgi:hypothetical protein
LKQLESSIESAVVREARALGCLVHKLHERNAPDRLFVTPDRRVFFIEFKRRGEKPRPEQLYEHERLRARGFRVYVIDSRKAGLEVIKHELYGEQ